MSLQIDAVLSGPWEVIGEAIRAAGQEDASGYRRLLVRWMANRKWELVARSLGITEDEAKELRNRFNAACVESALPGL
jgi:hypothetical protein